MRREIYRMDRAEALALLERAPVVHVASTTPEGAPVLRTVHGVLCDGVLAFHAAPAGEKTETVGRAAVVSAEEIVASIPSWFVDPERACPATTYYRSVQVHGVLERVEEPAAKARVLAALMAKYQPEGRHVPIDAAHRLYRAPVAGLLVLAIALEQVDGKAKLGQNRSPAELATILARLWERGLPGGPRAIDLLRDANPGVTAPFLEAPGGLGFRCAPGEDRLGDAVALLAGAYWNEGTPADVIARSHRGASAWVVAVDAAGALVATARALSDGTRHAWIHDLMVAPAWRGRGLGRGLLRLLLEHPAVRGARSVRLATRDPGFYAPLGFRPCEDQGRVVLERARSPARASAAQE